METLTKVTVPTVVLRDLVARAVKGSTNVDLIPFSSLMNVKVQDGKMSVTTTDNVNYLTTYADVVADNFEMMVQSKIFSQTVSKLTSETTTFIIDDKKVVVEANGKYNIPIVTDADGSAIKFDEVSVEPVGNTYHLKPEEVRSILTLSKSCKAEKNEVPAIVGNYYADSSKVLTTNYYKACSNPVVLTDSPILLSTFVMDLVSTVVDDSGVDVYQNSDYIVFESTNGRLIGKKGTDIAEYPAEDLSNLISNDLASSVQMNRTLFIQAVDRMCLFVDTYEQNRLYLTFTSEGLNLYSSKTESSEVVNYIKINTPITTPVKFSVDGFFLKNELTACDKEDITVRFSDEVGLQIKCGETTLMLGLLNEADEV